MNKKSLPLVSFVIPTYNAEKYLERCLNAIAELDYSKSRIEIILADGGSTDKTIEIAKKYTKRIIANPKRTAEYGKQLAFNDSKGEYIVFVDADNVIASRDWLKKMLKPFKHEDVSGVESEYLIADDFTSLNRYVTKLVIVDPLARMLAAKPKRTIKPDGYLIKIFKSGQIVVSGANGFIWRRETIERFQDTTTELNEVGLMESMSKDQPVVIGIVPGTGIYHYYVTNLKDYIQKRKKIAGKHLARTETKTTWVQRNGNLKLILCSIYLISIIGPLAEAIVHISKDKEITWLWHPVISAITIYTYFKASVMNKVKKG